jgi:hypothetical protein
VVRRAWLRAMRAAVGLRLCVLACALCAAAVGQTVATAAAQPVTPLTVASAQTAPVWGAAPFVQLGKRAGSRFHGGKNRSTPSPIAGELRLMPALDSFDPLALCNDGRCVSPAQPGPACAWSEQALRACPSYATLPSSSVYYFRKGYNPSLWLMYLQGGPACYDPVSCAAQPPQLVSSAGATRSIFLGGIFATGASKSSQFAEANVVWLPYCSSDAWLGDGNSTLVDGQTMMRVGDQFNGFPGGFRGQRIVRAALQSLVRELGFGSVESTRLLLGGCTPGVIPMLDVVADSLPSLGVKTGMVTVQGLFDSAALVDVAPLDADSPSVANMTSLVFGYVGAEAVPSGACVAAYGQADGWKCVFGAYALPYVRTPYLLAQPQFDRAQLSYNSPRPGSSPGGVAYAEGFQNAVQSLVQSLPAAGQTRSAVFSSACFAYCPSLSAAFWNVDVRPGGGARSSAASKPQSLASFLNAWFFENRRSLRLVDACEGWRCGACKASKGGGESTSAKALKSHADLAGPILICLFATLVLLGICLALASGPQPRREALRNAMRQEGTPLLSTRPGLVTVTVRGTQEGTQVIAQGKGLGAISEEQGKGD